MSRKSTTPAAGRPQETSLQTKAALGGGAENFLFLIFLFFQFKLIILRVFCPRFRVLSFNISGLCFLSAQAERKSDTKGESDYYSGDQCLNERHRDAKLNHCCQNSKNPDSPPSRSPKEVCRLLCLPPLS